MDDHVLVVMRDADMNEGRGPMVIDSVWADSARSECEKYVDSRPGIQGRRAKWSQSTIGDWRILRYPIKKKFEQRYIVVTYHEERGSIAYVIDRKENRIIGLYENSKCYDYLKSARDFADYMEGK